MDVSAGRLRCLREPVRGLFGKMYVFLKYLAKDFVNILGAHDSLGEVRPLLSFSGGTASAIRLGASLSDGRTPGHDASRVV